MQAKWNGQVIAESNDIVTVEGNAYFPRASLRSGVATPSDHTSVCGWKGTAGYLNLVVDGKTNENAVWFYDQPKPAAAEIAGRVAFWKGVQVG